MLMAIYPIMIGVVGHLRGRTILGWSLVALPFAVAVGAFNPLIDRVPVGEVAGVVITRGWVTLVSITLRAVVSVAVVVELVLSTGLYRLCINAGRLGVPRVIVVLLLMLGSLFTWLRQDLAMTFSDLTDNLTDAVIITDSVKK
jgi:cobalt/nickel transport system permease protein